MPATAAAGAHSGGTIRPNQSGRQAGPPHCPAGTYWGLAKAGHSELEDPILRSLPRHGGLAALAETYLPDDPDKAQQTFRKAEAAALTPARRLEVVNYELTRYTAVNTMPLARKTLSRLLEMLKAAPLDQETSRIVRSQMFALRSEANQSKRLLLLDDIRPAPESPATIVLTQLLHEAGPAVLIWNAISTTAFVWPRITKSPATLTKPALNCCWPRAAGARRFWLERVQQSGRRRGLAATPGPGPAHDGGDLLDHGSTQAGH